MLDAGVDVPDLAEEVDVLGLQEQRHGQRVHGRIAPPGVVIRRFLMR